MQKNYAGAIYLSIAASIWGGMFVTSKYALDTIPPFTLLFIRYALASVVLVLWCKQSGISVVPKQDKWTLFQIGFMGYFLSVATQFIGTKLSSAHMGAVITTLAPVFQSVFALLLLQEAVSRRQMSAIVLAVLGIFIVTDGIELFQLDRLNQGNLFFLIAAALWGYYSVLSRKISAQHPALRITTWGILLATGFAFPAAATEWGSWQVAVLGHGSILFSVFYLAVVSTTVAYYCWNRGLALLNPHQAGLFMFLQSVVGSILGYLLLDEELTTTFLVGTGLILLAVYQSIRSDKTSEPVVQSKAA